MLNGVQQAPKRLKESEEAQPEKVLVRNHYLSKPYFANSYPYHSIRRLLSLNTATRDNGYYGENLEFAFTYHSTGEQTYWKRYLAFTTQEQFRQFVFQNEPLRVDIGSYGFCPPFLWRGMSDRLKKFNEEYTDSHSSTLVIDVDLNDYNDIRVCDCVSRYQFCSDCHTDKTSGGSSCACEWRNLGKICRLCWCFATAGMLVVDLILRQYWGFVDFYFVFSGMKGFHCWILDPGTEEYTIQERLNFLQSFNPWSNAERTKVTDMDSMRTDAFSRTLDSNIELMFEQIILPTGLIFSYENPITKKLLHDLFQPRLLPDHVFEKFEAIFSKEAKKDGTILWYNCKRFLDDNYAAQHATAIKRCITYRYVFPRLDQNVTKQVNHPKKSPFSLHPESDKVCVPILPHHFEKLFEFTPASVPFSGDVISIKEITEEFDRDLAISGQIFLDYSLCCGVPRGFQPPIIDESLANKNKGSALVVSEFFKWAETINLESYILSPWDESHNQHYSRCKDCTNYTFSETRNTLRVWITEHSWNLENYSKVTELALKVAWLQYLRTKCPEIYLTPERIAAVKFYLEEWKLNDD